MTAMGVDQDTIASASEKVHIPPAAMDAITEVVLDQEPEQDLSNKGELIFQSLFEVKNTPPGSPGSATSSSTLVNPQSRKVSPTAVKDFAYPSLDSKNVCDPVAVIEATTKKELLKQLKKKTAAEEKATRKAVKLTAGIKALSAVLKVVKTNVQNSEAQADLAKTHANAMTLSNVVLREAVQELSLELSREMNISKIQGTEPQGETAWNQEKEESLQNHLEMVDAAGANVYHDIAHLLNASIKRDQRLDDTEDQESIQQANVPLPTDDVVESNEFGSSAVGVLDQKATEEPHVEEAGSDSAHEEPLAEVNGEELDDKACTDEETKEAQVGDGSCLAEESEEEKFENDTYPVEETTKELVPNVEWIFPGLTPKDFIVDKGQTTVDPIAADFEDAIPDQDGLSESSGEEQESEVDDDDSTPIVEDAISESERNEDPGAPEANPEALQSDNHIHGVVVGHDGGFNGNFEFSEPAGPATLWEILKSNQNETEVENKPVAAEGAVEFSETEGPAALWGILESEAVEKKTVASEEPAAASEAEAPGPATLWGILESERESSGNNSGGNSLEDKAEVQGSLVPDESESNCFAGDQDQDDAELVGLPHDDYSPDSNGGVDNLQDVSNNEDKIIEQPTMATAPAVEEDPAPSSDGSVDGEIIFVQEVSTQGVSVKVAMDAAAVDSPEDAVETVTEPIGDLEVAEEADHEVENGAVEAFNLQENVVSVGTNMANGAVEVVNEYAGNATVAQEQYGEEDQATQEANASEAHVVSEQPKDDCEYLGFEFTDNDAVFRAPPEEKQGPEEGETLEGPAAAGYMRVTWEEVNENESNDDHKLHDVAAAGHSITTAEGVDANSGVVHPQPATSPDTPASPPRESPSYQIEVFDFLSPMPKAKDISKTEKRKLERRRAAAKKGDEAAVKRRMEEEAAKTPEALAQRQAEEDTRLGEKRLKLQAARMQERLEMEASVPGAK